MTNKTDYTDVDPPVKVQVVAPNGAIAFTFVLFFIVPFMLGGAALGLVAGAPGCYVGAAAGVYLTFKIAGKINRRGEAK